MSDNSSTLNAYVDQAVGAAKSVIASVTGNPADQQDADATKAKGEAENDLSHATARAGPFTLSGTGAVAQDNPDRTQGSWNQTVGAAKEAVGGLLGYEGLKQAGIEQNREGKAQEASGQLNDLGSGIGDRVTGALGSAYAGLTGDKEAQAKFQDQHDVGKTLQRGVEAELQKTVEAQQKPSEDKPAQ
jgi:uncharacterized protein YjbJ (UPF0337 family)